MRFIIQRAQKLLISYFNCIELPLVVVFHAENQQIMSRIPYVALIYLNSIGIYTSISHVIFQIYSH